MVNIIRGSLGAIVIFIAGCAQTGPAPATFTADEYPAEISRLEAALLENESAGNSLTHLTLATLYRSHQNPNPNYAKALSHLDQYLLDETASLGDAESRDWRSVLRTLAGAQRNADDLKRQNRELNETINVLKTVDQGVEAKRKNYAE